MPRSRKPLTQNSLTDSQDPPTSTTNNFSPSSRVARDLPQNTSLEARKQAQDAILRLWPLNVRFHDYLDEGIDGPLLQGLFADLGLSVGASLNKATMPTDSTPVKFTPGNPEHAEATIVEVNSAKAAPAALVNLTFDAQCPGILKKSMEKPDSDAVNSSMDSRASHAESRKDRIARLLAAKSTKQFPALSRDISQTETSSPAQIPEPIKVQSEKSKLLQQKMEALKKTREAQAQKTASKNDRTRPTVGLTTMQPTVSIASAKEQAPVLQRSANVPSIAAIPGLHVSSTPQSSGPVGQQKRPMASELNDLSDASYKRPFGQNRQSQPFLIDVSDDDDDVVMDIDSPEPKPASVHRPSSPFRVPSFQNFPTLPNVPFSRQVSSPSIAPTPPGNSGNILAKTDLESMNKEIEIMKKKIAEAEARKRAKLSGTGSPSLQQSHGRSEEDTAVSSGTTSKLTTDRATDRAASLNGSEPHLPSSPGQALTEYVSRTLSKSRGRRPLARHNTHKTPSGGVTAIPATTYAVSSNRSEPVFLETPAPVEPTSQRLPKPSETRHLGQHNGIRSRSRAANERLPIIKANRKEKLLKLQELQAQVMRMEQEIEQSKREEERLRYEALEAESDDETSQAGSPSDLTPQSEFESCSSPLLTFRQSPS